MRISSLSLLLTVSSVYGQTACPSIPTGINYAANPKLPDPFLPLRSGRITKKADWPCRKAEIREVLQRFS